jgi:hypothetical protein
MGGWFGSPVRFTGFGGKTETEPNRKDFWF